MRLIKIKRMGSLLEFILKIGMVIGVIFLVSFYWILKSFRVEMNLFLGMVYPCGICFLNLMYQFTGLFGMLKVDTPFCLKTIIYLKRGMYVSFIISTLVCVAFSFLFFYDFYTLGVKFCVCFIGVLFFGVGIALYILKELFTEALEYKEENDLTI